MKSTGRSAVANGNITPYGPVMIDTTTDNRLIPATSAASCIGIAGKGTRYAPALSLDDGYLAIAGEVFNYWGAGEENVPALIGSGGCTAGDKLKADGSGGLVTASTDGNKFIAIARMSGASGDIIPVDVVIGQVAA